MKKNIKRTDTKKWAVYLNNVMATDLYSAVELVNFLEYVAKNKVYVPVLEVLEVDKDDLFIVSKN